MIGPKNEVVNDRAHDSVVPVNHFTCNHQTFQHRKDIYYSMSLDRVVDVALFTTDRAATLPLHHAPPQSRS